MQENNQASGEEGARRGVQGSFYDERALGPLEESARRKPDPVRARGVLRLTKISQ